MIEFSKVCEEVYARMQSESFRTTKGDEFILSLAKTAEPANGQDEQRIQCVAIDSRIHLCQRVIK